MRLKAAREGFSSVRTLLRSTLVAVGISSAFPNHLLAQTVSPPVAGAPTPAPPEAPLGSSAPAESPAQEGKRLLGEGRITEACIKLVEAFRMDQRLETLLDAASCHESEGRLATASREYNEAHQFATRDADPVRAELALSKLGEIGPRLRRLTVVVPAAVDVPGLEISVNGSTLARADWGLAVPVDPGLQRLLARAPGKQDFSAEHQAPGEAETLVVEIAALADIPVPAAAISAIPVPPPPPAAAPPPAPPPPVAAPSRRGFKPSVVLLGGAALLLTTGAVISGILFLDAKADFDGANMTRDPSRHELRDAAERAGIANIGFISGALLTGGLAAVLHFSDASAESRSAWRVDVRPQLGLSDAGLMARGRF